MSLIQRFLLGNRVDDDLQVGLFLKNDGTVWLRNPDGSETQVGVGAGGATVYQQTDDPGAVGAGSFWVNTSGIAGTSDLPLSVRDPSDSFWSPVGLAHYDGAGQLRGFVTMSDTAIVIEKVDGDGIQQAFFLIADDRVYISANLHPIWIGASLGGTSWGISAPSGAEKFSDIPSVPDDSEVATNQRIHWFDAATGTLRFKQADGVGAITAGHSVGITEDGVVKLPGLPTTDPGVADQLWCDTGADDVLKVSQG